MSVSLWAGQVTTRNGMSGIFDEAAHHLEAELDHADSPVVQLVWRSVGGKG
ncbi:MAG: hypothetical protein IPF48_02805 [Sphingomonadales bacterium]|nr:hypothetical protein [Sphingomonadales bacterium]